MESRPSELKFYRIDSAAGNDELLQRIKDILTEGGSHNASRFNNSTWKWQYNNLPTNDARVYVCSFESKITGYYHVPVYEGVVNGLNKKFAMVQDVAVSETMRGKGVFRKLAEFATDDLVKSDINLIYTFPNQKSIHTFLKYNDYIIVAPFDTYILPVRSSELIRAKLNIPVIPNVLGFILDMGVKFKNQKTEPGFSVVTKSCFDEKTVQLFEKFSGAFSIHLKRNEAYLNWRFFKKPLQKHFLFTIEKQGDVVASAILKTDDMLGVRAAILLDFAFTNENYLIQLIHHIKQNDEQLLNEKVSMIFTAFCCNKFLSGSKYGFIKIPEKLNPRPLNMLARNANETVDNLYQKNNWLATLADWDVL